MPNVPKPPSEDLQATPGLIAGGLAFFLWVVVGDMVGFIVALPFALAMGFGLRALLVAEDNKKRLWLPGFLKTSLVFGLPLSAFFVWVDSSGPSIGTVYQTTLSGVLFGCGVAGAKLLLQNYREFTAAAPEPPVAQAAPAPTTTQQQPDEEYFAFDPARFNAARSAPPPRARSRFVELIEQNHVDIASDDEARAFAEALHKTMEAELDRDIAHPNCPDDLRRFLIKVRDHLRRSRGAASVSQAEIEQHPGYPGIEDQRGRKR